MGRAIRARSRVEALTAFAQPPFSPDEYPLNRKTISAQPTAVCARWFGGDWIGAAVAVAMAAAA